MSRITVLGGTGYAGSAVVARGRDRGHQVTAFSRSLPTEPVAGVTYVQGEATDEAALASVVDGADVVVAALAPRGPLADSFRDVYRTRRPPRRRRGRPAVRRRRVLLAAPAPAAARFVDDLSHVPAALHGEILAGAALILEDLPAAPASLDWVFVSPAQLFGSFAPGERLGTYRLGDEVAVVPDGGGAISAPDYALGLVDLVEQDAHHRAHVNLAH